jgi:hypothetical protein
MTEKQLDYDLNFGDDVKCICGHTYFSHFDILTHKWAVECKKFIAKE